METTAARSSRRWRFLSCGIKSVKQAPGAA
jgi:hypothetical protein